MKIAICTPHYCGISKKTLKSIDNLKSAGYHVVKRFVEATYISVGRNTAILGKENSEIWPELDNSITYYLCLDSDIEFTVDNFETLISHNMPIVSGAYVSRKNENLIVAGNWGIKPGICGNDIPVTHEGLIKVDYCGAGFLLIKAEVFEKMPYPWFCHEWVEHEYEGIEHRTQIGEDYSFCLNAENYGYDILVDMNCRPNHLTNKLEEYEMLGQKAEERKDIDLRDIELEITKSLNLTTSVVGKHVEFLTSTLNNAAKQIAKLSARIKELEDEMKISKEPNADEEKGSE
jgi:hypothetical protein